LGEEAQSTFHSFFSGAIDPEGWHNQLKTEPALVLRARRSLLLTTSQRGDTWAADFIPAVGLSLGNVSTHIGAAALFRAGFGLPQDFMTAEHRPGRPTPVGLHAFGGVEGKAVGHDIFLDGNTWRSSQHVTKEPLVAEMKVGVAFHISGVELTAAYVWRTREFTRQRESDAYLSGTVRVLF
jgi:hypothetical protein